MGSLSIIDEIPLIHKTLYETFRKGTCRPLDYRREQLRQLARMLQENLEPIARALDKDLGRPRAEALGFEVSGIIDRALTTALALEEWSKPETVEVPQEQKGWSPTLLKAPKGPVLIIGPWNYPLLTTLFPLIAVISAGNPAVIKPSEIAPASAQLLRTLVSKYLDPKAYVVVNGAIPETTKLLEYKWGHILYTGNGRVARVVATAAAKHLTPVSLELGGKSPVVIDGSFDLDIAAKRILFGKTVNAGQTCIAPDYVLVPKEKEAELIKALRNAYNSFYPEGSAFLSQSFGRVVSARHFDRLKDLLGRSKGKIVTGGKLDEESLRFDLTVVSGVSGDDSLMEEEIFGPILPIVTVANIDEAVDFINARDTPLSLYAFTHQSEVKNKLINETSSGSLVFNDTVQQIAVKELPFSGVGESGYGYQNMTYGFSDFTHLRSSIEIPKEIESHLEIRYPPYSDEKVKILTTPAYQPIPV